MFFRLFCTRQDGYRLKKRFLIKILMVLIVAGLCLLGSGVIATALNSPGADSQSCKECHQSIYDDYYSMFFGHSVVVDNCAACHIKGQVQVKGTAKKDSLRSSDFSKEVLIYIKRSRASSAANSSYHVEVEASDRFGKVAKAELLDFKMADIDASLLGPSVRPVFERIEVDNVSVAGIFQEATISWTTNVYATTTLEYGLDLGYGFKAFTGKPRLAYYKEHRARLPQLKKNRTYHYRITGRSISGRIFRSRPQRFVVSDDGTASTQAAQGGEPAGELVIESLRPLKSIGGKLGVVVTVNRPVRVTLNAREDKHLDVTTELDRHGKGFISAKATRIDVCVGCHNQGISHPVGITANTDSTKVPEGLPTLPGGIITCNTCHTPHGGNKKFLARIDFKDTTMCAQCHIKEPFI